MIRNIRNLSLFVLAALIVAAASDPGRAADFVINEVLPAARAAIGGVCVLVDTIKDVGTRALTEFSRLDRNFHRHMATWSITLVGGVVLLIHRLIQRRHAIAEAVVRYASDLRKLASWLRVAWTVLRMIFR